MPRSSQRGDWLALWLLWSAWCSVSGWLLSAVGHLDRAGYAVSMALFLVGFLVKRRFWQHPAVRPMFLMRGTTYARPLPKLWLALTVLVLVGALFHHPDNYDFLTYRFPRILQWTWHHHWYWVDTANDRQNMSAVGMEWLMTPLFVLFQTDRLFFLINFVSFLFLPGLVFSVFRRLGISARIAWWWMWILPTGYCFLLQAGGMGNDGFAGTYFLAALYYALRADKDSPRMLLLSVLAIALVTGAKASNMPLMATWLAVLWMRRGPVLASVRVLPLIGTCLVGAVCSFLPIAIANIYYAGSYTGDPHNLHALVIKQPLIGITGNVLEAVAENLAPPIWPRPIQWPLPPSFHQWLVAGFPRFSMISPPLQFEEFAGVGFGVAILTLMCLGCGLHRRIARSHSGWSLSALVFALASLVAWLAFMSKLGSEAGPRLLACYYVAAIVSGLLLFPPEGSLTRRGWWRAAGYLVVAMAFFLLLLNPSRRLLPLRWLTGGLEKCHVPVSVVTQLENNYQIRETRRDDLMLLRQDIPETEKTIGWLSGEDDLGVSLWLPFGSREVVAVYPSTTDWAGLHIHYVAVSGTVLTQIYHLTVPELLAKWSMTLVRTEDIYTKIKRGHETWYLLKSS